MQPLVPAPMPLEPGSRLGAYLLLSRLGSGGMGEVFKARDPRLGRLVAIKALHPERLREAAARERIAREARLLAGLSHPNVLAIFDVGETEDGLFLVTECLEGAPLSTLMARGPLEEARAVTLAADLARGLAAVHARGIVHRDLKPSNVFVLREGTAKLLDFGLAKDLALTPGDVSLEGALVGTLGYLSPEQARGEAVDARTDLFNVGILLHEMLAGEPAFQRASAVETLHAALAEPPRGRLEGASEPLRRLVGRCLEKDPDRRFQSAADLAFALENLGGLPAAAPSTVSRRPWRWAVGLAGLAAVLVAWGLGTSTPSTASSPLFRPITPGPTWITAARFAPDGRSLAFSQRTPDGGQRLATFRFGDAVPREVDQMGRLVALGGDGELFFTDTPRAAYPGADTVGTLLRRKGGDLAPRAWVESVQDGDLDRSGQAAVVRRIKSPGDPLVESLLEWPAGHVVARGRAWFSCPRISPDGTRLAYIRHGLREDLPGQIVVLDPRGRECFASRPLPSLLTLAWTPDGKGWVYSWNPEPGGAFRISHLGLDGRERPLLAAPESLVLLDVARDGRLLLMGTGWDTGTSRIHVERQGRFETGDLGVRMIDQGACSPDGSLIAYGVREADGQDAIYLRPSLGGSPTRLTRGTLARAISPDNAWVLVQRRYQRLDGEGPAELALVPTGAGPEIPLRTEGLREILQARFLPGNRRVLVATLAEQQYRPCVLSPDAPPQPLPGGKPEDFCFAVAGEAGVVIQTDGHAPELLRPDGRRLPLPGLEPTHIPVGWDPAKREVLLLEGPASTESLASWSRRPSVRLWRRRLDAAGLKPDRTLTCDMPGFAFHLPIRELGSRGFLVDTAFTGTLFLVEGVRLD